MKDRELLELAAKAACIGPLDFDYPEIEGHEFYLVPRLPMPQGVLMAAMHTYWNPLEGDGDAFSLSVSMNIMIGYVTKPDAHMVGHVFAISRAGIFYEHGFSRESVRRAIVCAAAEVGKFMS